MGLLNRSATKVELKGVHLCCDACVDGVGVALKDVEGVESHCDIGNRTVTLTADDAAAQKALDALAAAATTVRGPPRQMGGRAQRLIFGSPPPRSPARTGVPPVNLRPSLHPGDHDEQARR